MPSSVAHPKQPCMLGRTLQLYPDLCDSSREQQLHEPLPDSDTGLWNHLPQACRLGGADQQLVNPALWDKSAKLTLHSLASYLLAGMFTGLRTEYKYVGYWLVLASEADKAAVATQQGERGRSHVDLGIWWRQYSNSSSWTDLSEQERQQVTAQAATALFCSPALTVMRGRLVDSCLLVKRKQGHVVLEHGYPHLVLQRSPYRVVACHVLVAWLFQGKPKQEGHNVVCHHHHMPLQQHAGVTWEHLQHTYAPSWHSFMQPVPSRCVSRKCLSPLCLIHGSRSKNSSSGNTKGQLAGKRGRDKLQAYTGVWPQPNGKCAA